MSPLTPQGKLGLKMLGGVFALVAVSAVLFALRGDSPPPRELSGVTVAAIVFDAPTDAWVSTSGTMALVADGEGYRLAQYGPGGETGSAAVDDVPVLDTGAVGGHVVYDDLAEGVLVIDQIEYSLGADGYVAGDCYWCTHELREPAVVADAQDGTWMVTTGAVISSVDQPRGWDGRPPALGFDPAGKVVIVAGLETGDTAVIDGKVCTVKGAWTLVAVADSTMLLHRVDADRRDYSVSNFQRCS